jgi:hypothetical protein
MRSFWFLLLLLFPPLLSFASDQTTPLAEIRTIECPHTVGERYNRSAVTAPIGSGASAFIDVRITRTPQKTCVYNARLHYSAEKNSRSREISLPMGARPSAEYYSIVDWSPDRHKFLLARTTYESFDKQTTMLPTMVLVLDARDGARSSQRIDELFQKRGWADCAVDLNISGFTPEGNIAIVTAPRNYYEQPGMRKCIEKSTSWSVTMRSGELQELPSTYAQAVHGRIQTDKYRPCKTDPDIVSACFALHGRVSLYNGAPAIRMWRVGTNRLLGILDSEDEIMPSSLTEKLGFGKVVYGDFEVCPFTKERPGEMQMVCVESAKNFVVKQY